MADAFEELRKDYARNAYEELDLASQRCMRFEDGSLWFPDGFQAQGATLGLMFASWPAIVGLGGAAIGIHDGADFGWYFLPVGVLGCGVFWLALRRFRGKKKAKEANLACGVFLLSDRIVIREPGYDRIRTRESFVGTTVRSAHDQRDHRVEYLSLSGKDGSEELPTQLTISARKLVNQWLIGSTPDSEKAIED